MKYISTRGGIEPITFKEATIQGLSRDGGLILPENIPQITKRDLALMCGKNYSELALDIMSRFIDDIPEKNLRSLVNNTYNDYVFSDKDITPLLKIEKGMYVLDLYEGPTAAFKDIALQFLGRTFEYILNETGSHLNILGATSGDTGSAAIHGVKGKEHMRIFIMYPSGERTSPIQAAQMNTVIDDNVFALEVDGTFDECQAIMKTINKDLNFKDKHKIGGVNSTNIARVIAQVPYYFKAYTSIVNRGNIIFGHPIDFSVPTGNFGDILAGSIAYMMGLPINRLLLATNENNVLEEFFKTGTYRARKKEEVIVTTSPSMDICVASNFERQLYYWCNQDSKLLSTYMQRLSSEGEFSVDKCVWDNVLNSPYVAGKATMEQVKDTIREVSLESGIVIDPHTAVGYEVGKRYQGNTPMICLGTAHYSKFESAINEALGFVPERAESLKGIEEKEKRIHSLPADVNAVRAFIETHAITK